MSNFISFMPDAFTDLQTPFSCTFNPDPKFARDCLGDTNNSKTYDTGTSNSSDTCYDKYMNALDPTNPVNLPNITMCYVNGKVQKYRFNPTFNTYQMILSQNKCTYYYISDDITELPYITPSGPDIKKAVFVTCNSPSGPQYPAPSKGKLLSPSIPPSPPPPPPVTKLFSLFENMLPITIPSRVNPNDGTGNYLQANLYNGDPSVDSYWLSEPSIPKEGYSDNNLYFDPNKNHRQTSLPLPGWTGFYSALSKCIELDGSAYPLCPSSTPSPTGTPSPTVPAGPPCSTPTKPVYKPNCYAVSVQSDFTGTSLSDRSLSHLFNYKLVELPTAEYIDNPDNHLTNFANQNQIDSNFLFCQTQFYTWVKNLPLGEIYNIYGPSYKPSTTPSATGPFSLSCQKESYPSLGGIALPELTVPKGFFDTPAADIPIIKVPPPPVNNTNRDILIGVGVTVAVLGGIYWWYKNFGPGADDDEDTAVPAPVPAPAITIPVIPTTATADIQTKKGGYFYY
jgi:hypothetical protein